MHLGWYAVLSNIFHQFNFCCGLRSKCIILYLHVEHTDGIETQWTSAWLILGPARSLCWLEGCGKGG